MTDLDLIQGAWKAHLIIGSRGRQVVPGFEGLRFAEEQIVEIESLVSSPGSVLSLFQLVPADKRIRRFIWPKFPYKPPFVEHGTYKLSTERLMLNWELDVGVASSETYTRWLPTLARM